MFLIAVLSVYGVVFVACQEAGLGWWSILIACIAQISFCGLWILVEEIFA